MSRDFGQCVTALTAICGKGTLTKTNARCTFRNEIVQDFTVLLVGNELFISQLTLHRGSVDCGYRAAIVHLLLTLCRIERMQPCVCASLAQGDPKFWQQHGFKQNLTKDLGRWYNEPWHW